MKYDFACCAVGDAGKKGIFYTFLKFEILCSGIEVSVAHPKVTAPPPRFSVSDLGGHMVHTENHE